MDSHGGKKKKIRRSWHSYLHGVKPIPSSGPPYPSISFLAVLRVVCLWVCDLSPRCCTCRKPAFPHSKSISDYVSWSSPAGGFNKSFSGFAVYPLAQLLKLCLWSVCCRVFFFFLVLFLLFQCLLYRPEPSLTGKGIQISLNGKGIRIRFVWLDILCFLMKVTPWL